VTVAEAGPAVSVRGLRKNFGDSDVLEVVEFDADEGEITLLMGPNGVGKTILLSCLAGGLQASEGDISVLGDHPEATKERLSFMLQDTMLVDELTGRENVAFFRDLHPRSTDGVESVLDRLDFEMDALGREVRDYSGGMKRKLELAISLNVDAPLFLLDEPTAALDMTTVETLHSLLAARRDAGETIILSSHLPGDADLADRIVVLTEDGVSAVGSPEDLLAEVPPVVFVEGPGDVSESVRDGRLFEGEIHRRGFLRADRDPEAVTDNTDGTAIQVRDPSYTDMFNYYVHLRGNQ